jgi:hypothetical protein
MGKEKQVNLKLKIPEEWAKKLQKIANKSYCSSEDIVREIIAEYLNVNSNNLQIQKLYENLNKVEQRLSKIEQNNYNIEDFKHKLNTLEKLIILLQNKDIKSGTSRDINSADNDDDFYDEPDEILTDFL